MSHERRVGIRFESRARGALRGPRAALHRVAGRAPAARPCVRLIAIGEAVSRLSCSRRLVCTPGPSIAHKLYPRVPRRAPGTATAQPSGQPRKPETDSRKLPSGSAWNCRDCGNASPGTARRQTEPGNAAPGPVARAFRAPPPRIGLGFGRRGGRFRIANSNAATGPGGGGAPRAGGRADSRFGARRRRARVGRCMLRLKSLRHYDTRAPRTSHADAMVETAQTSPVTHLIRREQSSVCRTFLLCTDKNAHPDPKGEKKQDSTLIPLPAADICGERGTRRWAGEELDGRQPTRPCLLPA